MSGCGLHCMKIEGIGVTLGGRELLREVNLHAHCGELTVIIGRNGAGKSTLLKALLGELPHSGRVTFSGHGGAATVRRPSIGYVPQSLPVDSGSPTTVYDLLLSMTSPYPVLLPRRRKTVAAFTAHLERFRAGHLLDQPVGRLSGGELQRVLLAAATYTRPDLLMLDEPVSGVDRPGLLEFYQLLEELKEQEDLVILLVSHDLDFVRTHADRVVLLNNTVEAVGTPEQVFATDAFRHTFGEGRV